MGLFYVIVHFDSDLRLVHSKSRISVSVPKSSISPLTVKIYEASDSD